MKRVTLFLITIALTGFTCGLTSHGKALRYVSASQRIISPASQWPTLFELNVTYPYEAKTGEDFSIYIQLWQGKNTSVFVGIIKIIMPQNTSEALISNKELENPAENETLVVDRTLTLSVQKSQSWYINIWYSVKDLAPGGAWAIGGNSLASFNIYLRTHDELAKQLADQQTQTTDLQNQQYGFIFIALYLTATLGIAMPIMQKRRKTVSHTR